jgi:hypothetical protein
VFAPTVAHDKKLALDFNGHDRCPGGWTESPIVPVRRSQRIAVFDPLHKLRAPHLFAGRRRSPIKS